MFLAHVLPEARTADCYPSTQKLPPPNSPRAPGAHESSENILKPLEGLYTLLPVFVGKSEIKVPPDAAEHLQRAWGYCMQLT